MKFGTFYEHQLPRPWEEGDEQRLVQESLEQVELADRLGIEYAWEVEHHFLEEYSHSSAPEVFLAACSQRTKNIRLGHGIVLMPVNYNHPARVAERIATLDLVSNGRVEFGTGESSAILELEGFDVSVEDKRDQWFETVEQCANMMAMDPYPGFEGRFFSMPCRSVVPKPVQRPHPPLWVACSNRETIKLAARLGMGRPHVCFRGPDRGEGVGRRLLPHPQGGVCAHRACGECQHRHGHRLLLPRGPGRKRSGAAPTASASSPIRSATSTSTGNTNRASQTCGPSSRRTAVRSDSTVRRQPRRTSNSAPNSRGDEGVLSLRGAIGTPDQIRR